MVAACVYASALTLLKRPIPSMQCKVAAGPAILTGALWSLGNFLSIYAVEYLGLSLGWPIVQCQLIISSLWCAPQDSLPMRCSRVCSALSCRTAFFLHAPIGLCDSPQELHAAHHDFIDTCPGCMRTLPKPKAVPGCNADSLQLAAEYPLQGAVYCCCVRRGILYYHEIEGWITLVLFGISTAIILVGVFVLATYGV